MNYDSRYHHRRSIRLPEYDYSQSGVYFITVCTYQKQCLLGDIQDGKMFLNQIGRIVEKEWLKSLRIRQEIELAEWIIMPNHLHGIVIITEPEINVEYKNTDVEGANIEGARFLEGASLAPLQGNFRSRKGRSLSSFIGGLKSSVTKRIKEICEQPNPPVWQRNYYESIVQDEQQLNNIRHYIINNPQEWENDPENTKDKSQELLIDFPF